MRAQASRASRTNAYLMRNDAVIVSGNETGWVKVQGADVVVTDTHENTVEADTTGKADGIQHRNTSAIRMRTISSPSNKQIMHTGQISLM